MVRSAIRRYRDSYRGLPREAWLLACVLLINRCGMMVIPFLTIYLTAERSYTPIDAGWLLSGCGLGAIAGVYVGGLLTQRFGPARVICFSLAASAPAYAVIPWCTSPSSLAAALATAFFVADLMRPACSTAATLLSPPAKHAQAMALNRLAANLGTSIGPVVGGLLAEFDFRLIFPANAAANLIAAATMARFFTGKAIGGTDEDRPGNQPARSPWRDRQFLLFLSLHLLISIPFFQMMTTLPLYWSEQLHFREATIGVLFAVNTLLIVAAEMPLTRWANRFRRLRVVAVGCLLFFVGFGLTPLGTGVVGAGLVVLVWTVGEMLLAPFTMAYVASRSDASNRGLYMGAFSTAVSLAAVTSPAIGLAIYSWRPEAPWWLALAAAPVICGGMLWLDRAAAAEEVTSASQGHSPARAAAL